MSDEQFIEDMKMEADESATPSASYVIKRLIGIIEKRDMQISSMEISITRLLKDVKETEDKLASILRLLKEVEIG